MALMKLFVRKPHFRVPCEFYLLTVHNRASVGGRLPGPNVMPGQPEPRQDDVENVIVQLLGRVRVAVPDRHNLSV